MFGFWGESMENWEKALPKCETGELLGCGGGGIEGLTIDFGLEDFGSLGALIGICPPVAIR